MTTRLDDRAVLWDCLKDQKYIAGNYINMATETSNTQLLQDTIKICQDAIRANYDIFHFMNQRGWYPVQVANPQDITQVKSSVQQMQNNISYFS